MMMKKFEYVASLTMSKNVKKASGKCTDCAEAELKQIDARFN